MAAAQPLPPHARGARSVGTTLRPTTRQVLGSALAKACCALPVLIAVPVTSGSVRRIVLIVAVVAALVVFAIDVLAQRDSWAEVEADGLRTIAGLTPWWAVDELTVIERAGERRVRVRSFDTIEYNLPVPRSGHFGSNRDFDDEVDLLTRAWERYRSDRPAYPPVSRPSMLSDVIGPPDDLVIDLRDDATEPQGHDARPGDATAEPTAEPGAGQPRPAGERGSTTGPSSAGGPTTWRPARADHEHHHGSTTR